MFVKILKFIGAIALMSLIESYLPFGGIINMLIIFAGVWKLVNE